MQAIQKFKESSQQLYLVSNIRNLKLQSQLPQIDLILDKLQIREQYLFDRLVNVANHNLPLGMIYAKELQQVRALKTKIHNIKQQIENFHVLMIAAKKHAWRQNS